MNEHYPFLFSETRIVSMLVMITEERKTQTKTEETGRFDGISIVDDFPSPSILIKMISDANSASLSTRMLIDDLERRT